MADILTQKEINELLADEIKDYPVFIYYMDSNGNYKLDELHEDSDIIKTIFAELSENSPLYDYDIIDYFEKNGSVANDLFLNKNSVASEFIKRLFSGFKIKNNFFDEIREEIPVEDKEFIRKWLDEHPEYVV